MKRLDNQLKLLSNERGIALIMGIILILAISLFGMIGMTITTREIRGAGANRLSEQRFYEAQMGVTEALLRPNDLLTDNFLTQPVATAQGPPLAIIDPSDGTPLANVIIETVQNLDPATAALRGLPLMSHTGPPPNGYSVEDFQALYFSVTSSTLEPNLNDQTVIRQGVWRAFAIVK